MDDFLQPRSPQHCARVGWCAVSTRLPTWDPATELEVRALNDSHEFADHRSPAAAEPDRRPLRGRRHERQRRDDRRPVLPRLRLQALRCHRSRSSSSTTTPASGWSAASVRSKVLAVRWGSMSSSSTTLPATAAPTCGGARRAPDPQRHEPLAVAGVEPGGQRLRTPRTCCSSTRTRSGSVARSRISSAPGAAASTRRASSAPCCATPTAPSTRRAGASRR